MDNERRFHTDVLFNIENKFRFPDFSGRKILCIGLGGGADAISAFLCTMIVVGSSSNEPETSYGNTKRRVEKDVSLISDHIGYFQGPQITLFSGAKQGSTQIDRSLPKGPGNSPLVFQFPKERPDETIEALGGELRELGIDLIIGVDTGGDVLKRKGEGKSRDRQMLRAVLASGVESLLVILGLSSDGNAPKNLIGPLMEVKR